MTVELHFLSVWQSKWHQNNLINSPHWSKERGGESQTGEEEYEHCVELQLSHTTLKSSIVFDHSCACHHTGQSLYFSLDVTSLCAHINAPHPSPDSVSIHLPSGGVSHSWFFFNPEEQLVWPFWSEHLSLNEEADTIRSTFFFHISLFLCLINIHMGIKRNMWQHSKNLNVTEQK